MEILIVEDDIFTVMFYRKMMSRGEHRFIIARDGLEASAIIQKEKFDVVITDWMMPKMDGKELIQQIKTHSRPIPSIMVVSALDIKAEALEAGADEFFSKPINVELLEAALVKAGHSHKIEYKEATKVLSHAVTASQQNFYGITICAGSGETAQLRRLLSNTTATMNAAFFVVMHSSSIGIEALAKQLTTENSIPVVLASTGTKIEKGKVYLAPGHHHMILKNDHSTIQLTDTPPENFVRPAADPLMKSVAIGFGKKSIGIVLGGTNMDCAIGAGNIHAVGGKVFVINPKETQVPQMPQNIITLGNADRVFGMNEMIRELKILLKESGSENSYSKVHHEEHA